MLFTIKCNIPPCHWGPHDTNKSEDRQSDVEMWREYSSWVRAMVQDELDKAVAESKLKVAKGGYFKGLNALAVEFRSTYLSGGDGETLPVLMRSLLNVLAGTAFRNPSNLKSIMTRRVLVPTVADEDVIITLSTNPKELLKHLAEEWSE